MSDDRTGDLGSVARHYSGVSHEKGPAIYRSSGRYDAIFKLGKFKDLPKTQSSRFADLMSGVGCLVASAVEERARDEGVPLEIHCLDIAFSGMDITKRKGLEDRGYILRAVDITEGTGYEDSFLDRVATSFGIKNYGVETQMDIFSEVKRIMVPGGVFVLADMISPEASYEWMQDERREKSRHTFGEENARHHVPTLDGWFQMLGEAGLEPERDNVYHETSYVDTQKWVDSNQMSADGRREMDEFLLSAPEHAIRDFNIRQEGDSIRIDYPTIVITAR